MLPNRTSRWADPFLSNAWFPTDTGLDVREDEDSIHLAIDLPGFRKEEVHITQDRGLLKVHAETQVAEDEPRRERHVKRQFRIAEAYQGAEVNAHIQDGVLSISLKKPEAVKPRQIAVQ